MNQAVKFVLVLSLVTIGIAARADQKSSQKKRAKEARPNILWIAIEDWSPDLSCYGTKGIHTPHVDKLASQGIRYETAFTTSPVCSTSRSAMMTGFHPLISLNWENNALEGWNRISIVKTLKNLKMLIVFFMRESVYLRRRNRLLTCRLKKKLRKKLHL